MFYRIKREVCHSLSYIIVKNKTPIMKRLTVSYNSLVLVVCMAIGVCSYGQTISCAANAPRCGDVIKKKPYYSNGRLDDVADKAVKSVYDGYLILWTIRLTPMDEHGLRLRRKY